MPRLSKIGAAALAAFGWTSGTGAATTVTASYLVVAGGGGGVGNSSSSGAGGGGGGAGGLLTGTTSLNPTLSYTITVGAGGAGDTNGTVNGINGSNSVFNAVTTIGGGGGGNNSANNGGSGGGGRYSGTAGTGTSGQGNNGGTGNTGTYNGGGGGGGAGAVGGNGSGGGSTSNAVGGNGGVGVASSISGTSTYYAGGGGGGIYGDSSSTIGTGGNGGGGNGNKDGNGSSGTANTGGGGGASGRGSGTTYSGGNGGSGVVIISYSGAQQFGGGVVTSVGGNTIHTFTTSGTLSPISALTASYLIVAGGGGGGRVQAGGGGAGGLLSGSGITIDTNSTYLVTVGSGGAGSTTTASGINGTNSAFSIVTTTAIGGGGGASSNYPSATVGSSGGSGAGGSNGSGNGNISGSGGTGTSGQGNAGGYGWVAVGNAYGSGGGGGGAGAVGADAASGQAGAGGVGVASSISGSSTYYAGGGGGGGDTRGSTAGAGGNGGGGAGGNVNGVSGTANTGGGGGGGSYNAGTGGSGGSGVVIISYAGSTQLMAGGTVTISGGNVIHTFTSSGYLTPLKLVNNSLRFRKSNTAYLSRTPPTSGNRRTWTLSMWVKLGSLSSGRYVFGAGSTTNCFSLFGATDIFSFSNYTSGPSYDWELISTSVYRDPAAWYHLVYVVDTTQATASNRVKIYINGVQITSFSTATYPAQNIQGGWNLNELHTIGSTAGSLPFDGYMTEINAVDGQALTPNSFGTFNSYGVWQPITYGGSYGTNGFYLPFNSGSQTYAGSFNGSSQGLTIPYNANVGTSNFTVEGWYYFNSVSATSNPLLFYSGNGSGAVPKINIYFSSNGILSSQATTTGANTITSSVAVTTGQWYHIACVRNSGTYTMYINGVAVASGSNSVNITGITGGSAISYPLLGDGTYVNGSISNFRFNSTTAVYTSSFTPPIANLTAISGTQLLTLQNATIVDNSTNAYTITNNGATTTALTYPFSAAKIFNDQGPAGNNWTPNNISGQNGSTLDYMTDVPTLTSATAANYCTLNPISNPNGTIVTYSNGNLAFSHSASSGNAPKMTVQGTMAFTAGKFYWEYTVGATVNDQVGIGTMLVYGGSADGTAGARYIYNGTFQSTYTVPSAGASYTTGDIIGMAYDQPNGTLAFYKNNSLQGTITAISTTEVFFALRSVGSSGTGGTGSFNFGQQPFTYTPPTNFVALNTYNL